MQAALIQFVKYAKFIEAMLKVNGASFIAIDTETNVPLKGGKSNPLQNHVTKRVVGSNVMVFTNQKSNGYENMVQRRLQQEGKNPNDFALSARQWGERIQDTPFVSHKGQLYLEVIFLRAGEVTYFVDGVETDPRTIDGLEIRTVDDEAEQGGLDNKVIIRTYKVDSIVGVRVDGQSLSFV